MINLKTSLTGIFSGLLLGASLSINADTLLTVDELDELFSDTTQRCDQTGKDAQCVTYTSANNRVVRVMTSGKNTGKRYVGSWEVNRHGLFCILWDGKDKDLCFVVSKNTDGQHELYLRGYKKATILSVESGNTEGLMESEK